MPANDALHATSRPGGHRLKFTSLSPSSWGNFQPKGSLSPSLSLARQSKVALSTATRNLRHLVLNGSWVRLQWAYTSQFCISYSLWQRDLQCDHINAWLSNSYCTSSCVIFPIGDRDRTIKKLSSFFPSAPINFVINIRPSTFSGGWLRNCLIRSMSKQKSFASNYQPAKCIFGPFSS